MGIYLNSKTAYTLYRNETEKPFFVDKSQMLEELFPLVREGNNHICITRPRRFGKTVTANMIASFFSKASCADELFQKLQIAQANDYNKYLNQFRVIHISFNDTSGQCTSYYDYIQRINNKLVRDLKKEYPFVEISHDESVIDVLIDIYAEEDTAKFIFVFDEWDYIFHHDFVTEEDKKAYLLFLRSLLKDRPYVLLAYMTGILPIAKYSSGSELNMFAEYTMATEERFSEYFGFTEKEVDALFRRYQTVQAEPRHITRDGLKSWYDGYHTRSGERLYNPRSVVLSLTNNNFGNYWTSSGPYDEIYYYIEKNVDAVRNDLAFMVSGEAIPIKIREYAATSMNLSSREEIFSAMVVYGFLSFEDGKVSIPNKELMDKFTDMLQKKPAFGYVYNLARKSGRMLQATLHGDTKTMAEILERAHNTETPLLNYNDETELTAIVNLVYLSARDIYRIDREDRAGKGYVDFIFYPEKDKDADCIILELKVNHTPQEAIRQIKEKEYALRFKGRLGDPSPRSGRILAVGISYDKRNKKHSCAIEIL